MSDEITVQQYRAILEGKSRSGLATKIKVVKPAPLAVDLPVTTTELGWQTIQGTCPSKSNSYRIVENRLVKTSAMIKFEDSFFIQCHLYRNANIQGYFELCMDVYYPNQRSDLDGVFKGILDCLQRAKAIKDDRKCVKIVAQKFLDKANPRIEFCIKPV